MKITNYRPIVFVTVSLLVGLTVGGLVYTNTIFLISVPVALIAMGIFFSAVFKKKIIFFMLLFFSIGIVSFYADYNINFTGDVNSENVYIQARVKENKETYLLVEDIIFDGKAYSGHAMLENVVYENYSVGDTLTLVGTVTTNGIDIFDTYLMSQYNDKIYYDITAGNYVKAESGELKFFEKLKNSIIEPILKYMPEEEAGITISLLFGDKTYLTDSDNETIKGVGLSHIFAVSGLHVGFLVALIIFVSKKLRIKPLIQLAVIILMLSVYGGLTGFPAGVKRAAIMSVIYLLSVIAGRKNDNLNTLALSVMLIVITNPRELFDISFLMSVSAILGIICFYRPIYKLICGKSYNKARKFVSASVATSLSANIFLMPICFNVFNTVATYMLLSNLLILPLVSIAYTAIMIVVLMSVVYSGFGIIYTVASYPVTLIRQIANLIYSFPAATVTVASLGVLTVFYLAVAVINSRYVMIETNKKLVFTSVFSSLGAILFVIL